MLRPNSFALTLLLSMLTALGPLTMMAELGEDNGLPMYADNNGAIHMLIKRTLAGLLNNSYCFVIPSVVDQDSSLCIEWSKVLGLYLRSFSQYL